MKVIGEACGSAWKNYVADSEGDLIGLHCNLHGLHSQYSRYT